MFTAHLNNVVAAPRLQETHYNLFDIIASGDRFTHHKNELVLGDVAGDREKKTLRHGFYNGEECFVKLPRRVFTDVAEPRHYDYSQLANYREWRLSEIMKTLQMDKWIVNTTLIPINIKELEGMGDRVRPRFLVMAKERPLEQYLEEERLTPELRRRFTIEIGNAFADFHAHGICHGDLKEQNVVVDKDHHIKIIDFGYGIRFNRHYATDEGAFEEARKNDLDMVFQMGEYLRTHEESAEGEGNVHNELVEEVLDGLEETIDKQLGTMHKLRKLNGSDCKVCGDRHTGNHFGVKSCDACKQFFGRTWPKRNEMVCSKDGQCKITPRSRSDCEACHMRMCLHAGMVKRERAGNNK